MSKVQELRDKLKAVAETVGLDWSLEFTTGCFEDKWCGNVSLSVHKVPRIDVAVPVGNADSIEHCAQLLIERIDDALNDLRKLHALPLPN